MKALNVISLLLIIVGAINWGLWGFFQFDLVAYLFGGNTTGVSRIVYSIIGLGGLWSLRFLGRCKVICCNECCCKSNSCDKGGQGSCKM